MVYYNDPREAVKNFVQNGENVFKLEPRRPPHFKKGVLIQLGLMVFLSILSFFLAKRSMYRLRKSEIKKHGQLNPVNLDMGRFEITALQVEGRLLGHLLYLLLQGKLDELGDFKLNGTVTLNGQDIVNELCRACIMYLPPAEYFPDEMKVTDFIRLVGRMYDSPEEKANGVRQTTLPSART